MKLNILGLSLLLLITSCKTSKNTNDLRKNGISTRIDSIVESTHFNGVIILARDSIFLYKKAFGYSNLKKLH